MVTKSQLENVDVVKAKLKQSRDKIKIVIDKKNKDIFKIDSLIE